MKKLVLILLFFGLFLASPAAHAADGFMLGNVNVAAKAEYLHFNDSAFGNDLKDAAYFGLEAYAAIPVVPNLYIGLESGWAGSGSDGRLDTYYGSYKYDTDVNYVPIEFNLKYVVPFTPAFSLGLGGGVSYNYFNIDLDTRDFSDSLDDWVFGGQFFADVTYRVCNWFFSVEGKYQITEELEYHNDHYDIDSGVSADNWRVGLKAGMVF